MKKLKLVLFVLTITYCQNVTSQVVFESQTSMSIKLDQDINFKDGSGVLTLSNTTIETSGNIQFLNPKIILINCNIKCKNIDLKNVTDLSISKTVNINCTSLVFPSKILPIKSSGSDARLSILYKSTFVNSTNYSVPSSTDFSLSITK